mmetsp:Transcript_57798/g.152058  ORF Transcript_57798/g.152058 Transcript_57798/m.152058 type:complete len:514 (+) Transcript_57798:764-2305(+)
MAGGELVSDLWPPRLPCDDLIYCEPLIVAREDHTVDVRGDRILVGHWGRFVLDLIRVQLHELLCFHRNDLVCQKELVLNLLAGAGKTVLTEDTELGVLHACPLLFETAHDRRRREHVLLVVAVARHRHALAPHDEAPPEAAVEGRAVHDDGVLDIVAAVAHDRHGRVLPRSEVVELHEVQRLARAQRLLRVDQAEQERVGPVVLVHRDAAHGLLAHRALVGVPRRLVVVGVGDEARDDAEQRERLDLEVRRVLRDVRGLQRDEEVVLLVHVDPLHDPLLQEVLERHPPFLRRLRHQRDVLLREEAGLAVLDDDERAAEPTGVGGDDDGAPALVLEDGHELADAPEPAQELEVGHELLGPPVDAEQGAVEEDLDVAEVVQLLAGDRVRVLDAEAVADVLQAAFRLARRHVREQGEVLHQAALLALGGVRRTEHAPLRRLQRARPGHLAALLELRLHPHHGADAGHVGEAREDLGHAGAVDAEPLDVPVPGGDRVHHGLRELRPVLPLLQHVRVA